MKRILCILLFTATANAADFAKDFAPAIATLRAAAGDAAKLRSAIDALSAIETQVPRERELVLYSIGYAQRQLGFRDKAMIVEAQKTFEALIKLNPKNAEAHALLASVLGIQIGFDRSLAMDYGPRASFEMETALQLAPDNPRVLLLAGTSKLHKPREYGGGVEAAEEPLRRAAALLDAEPSNRPWPNWGRAEARVMLERLEKAKQR